MNNYGNNRYGQNIRNSNNRNDDLAGARQIHTKLNKENYVEIADCVMKKIVEGDRRNALTTSKIRNLLSMVSDLYNGIKREHSETLNSDWISRVQYVRMHFAYEAGREKAVKNFVEQADLLDVINDIGNSREKLILFCHYMEALVAYHRFHGGKDN